MKDINHNYWENYDGSSSTDPDQICPNLRIAMNQLYGKSKFDFGVIESGCLNAEYNIPYDKKNCSPDGYSTYTSLTGNYIKKMPFRKEAVDENKELVDKLLKIAGTIAGELFFPCHKIANKATINQERGTISAISDRIDLTLCDIKRFYESESSDYPLKETFTRYKWFFEQFDGFNGYVKHCLLQDFIDKDDEVILWKKELGLPTNKEELVSFWEWSISMLKLRLHSIKAFVKQNNILES